MNALHQLRPLALNRVGSRLVKGLALAQIVGNLIVGKLMEGHQARIGKRAEAKRDLLHLRRCDHPHRNCRDNLMRAAGKLAKHVLAIGETARLAENLTVLHHHRIRADDDEHARVVFGQHLLHHGARLALGKLLACLGGISQLVGLKRLIHRRDRRAHREGDARFLKQLAATRARTCQHYVKSRRGLCRYGFLFLCGIARRFGHGFFFNHNFLLSAKHLVCEKASSARFISN